MKIHIIGCSGSGKTYLAKVLSDKYKIPHFDLDDIQWDNTLESYGIKRTMEKRTEMLQELLAKDEWIIEGVYYAWVQQSFEESDIIYVLDMPTYFCKLRVIRRAIKRKTGLEQGKGKTLKSVLALLKWIDTFQSKNRREIRELMRKYEDKVVWLSNRNAVKEARNRRYL